MLIQEMFKDKIYNPQIKIRSFFSKESFNEIYCYFASYLTYAHKIACFILHVFIEDKQQQKEKVKCISKIDGHPL